jgi:hypothetical protein
MAAVM